MLLLSLVLAGISQPACAQSTVFTTQTPVITGTAGSFELGMKFQSSVGGTITAIRFWKDASETGTHVGQIWSSTGTSLASTTFVGESTSGWQQQALATPLTINANTTYVVSVNANSHYVATNSGPFFPVLNADAGLFFPVVNGPLASVADSNNGVFDTTPGNFPTQFFEFANYFRDVVFTPSVSNPPTPMGCLEKLVSVDDGVTFAAYPDFTNPAVAKTGAPVEFQLVVTNCGNVFVTPSTVDDCINANAKTAPFACAPISAGGQGAPGLILYEPPTPAPTSSPIAPGSSVTYTTTQLGNLFVTSTQFANLCATAISLTGTPVVRNDVEFDGRDANGNPVGYQGDAYVMCPNPSPINSNCIAINAVVNVPITPVTLTATGGVGPPYTFTATGLPNGLSISPSGTISGTPTVTGTFSYTVTITDSAGNKGTLNCSVTVISAPTSTCVVINATQGVPITPVTLTATGGAGGPYTFTATGLPNGLSISPSGTISGTPTVTGTFNYTVTITDSAGNSGSLNCSVTVNSVPASTCVVINATQGIPITPVTLTATGGAGGPYTFTATGLPTGLSISSGGTISGTPTVTGTFNYTVTITDSAGNKGTLNCSVTVKPPAVCSLTPGATAISGSPVSWNGFKAPTGSVVWINAHIGTPSGLLTNQITTVDFTGVILVVNATSYALPNGHLVFNPAAPATPSTVVNADGSWTTTLNPHNLSDEIFFDGQAIPVDSNLTNGGGGNTNSTLSYTTTSNSNTLSFQWQWGAAVYTSWPGNAAANIEPVHAAQHAGAPLNPAVEANLIQGPRGGGGSNFTGSWSGTGQGTCPSH